MFLVAGVLCLLGVGMLLALSTTPHSSRNWQTGARWVASSEGWYPVPGNPFYRWLSNSEVLCIEIESKPGFPYVLNKHDIATGKVSAVATLPPRSINRTLNTTQLSPDGNLLLWQYTDPQWRQTVGVVDIRPGGSSRLAKTWVTTRHRYGNPTWLPDSSGWFDIHGQMYLVNRAKVHRSTEYAIDLFQNATLLGQSSEGDWIVCPYQLKATVGVSNRELVRLVPPANTRPGAPREIKSEVTRRNGSISIAPLALSPSGTEILWFERRLRNPWQAKAEEWLATRGWHISWAHWDTGKETILFTSDLQGRNHRDLGVLPDEEQGFDPESVQWTPDGKHISFIWDSALYVRPIR